MSGIMPKGGLLTPYFQKFFSSKGRHLPELLEVYMQHFRKQSSWSFQEVDDLAPKALPVHVKTLCSMELSFKFISECSFAIFPRTLKGKGKGSRSCRDVHMLCYARGSSWDFEEVLVMTYSGKVLPVHVFLRATV